MFKKIPDGNFLKHLIAICNPTLEPEEIYKNIRNI